MQQSKIVLLTWDDSNEGPSIGNQLPFPPVYPSQGLPNRPGVGIGNQLPNGSVGTLPVFPFDPTAPVDPDAPPPASTKPIVPGARFIVKYIACVGLALVPDNELPEAPIATPKSTK